MLKKFIILYKHLFLHLFIIWLVIILSFLAIYGVLSLERYYNNHLNEKFAECKVILYIDNKTNPNYFTQQLKEISFIESLNLDHNAQTIQKIEHDFQLYDLQKWLNTNKFPHIITFNLKGANFDFLHFKNLLRRLTLDDSIKKLNFNAEKIISLNQRKQQLDKFKFLPLYLIALISIIIIFLLTRLMRVKRKIFWKRWRVIEKGHTHKLAHSIIEYIITVIVSFGIIIFANYRWGKEFLGEFYINLLNFKPHFYFMVGIFIFYVLVSLINQIEICKNHR